MCVCVSLFFHCTHTGQALWIAEAGGLTVCVLVCAFEKPSTHWSVEALVLEIDITFTHLADAIIQSDLQ